MHTYNSRVSRGNISESLEPIAYWHVPVQWVIFTPPQSSNKGTTLQLSLDLHTFTWAHTHTQTHTYTHRIHIVKIWECICVYIYTYIYLYIHVGICIFACIHMHATYRLSVGKIKKKMRGFYIFSSVYFLITIQQITIQWYMLVIVMN